MRCSRTETRARCCRREVLPGHGIRGSKVKSHDGQKLVIQFGVNSEPVAAGVIGTQKFRCDIWGDTVNVASRMESTSETGKIQVSDATFELPDPEFDCQPRGSIEGRGRGSMETWYVIGTESIKPSGLWI